jgi:LmbE family N-acetylglucosaminyl deacetylase
MAPPRLLGVFAHPDDEVFCAGGTLAVYTARGAEGIVCSATRGEAGQIRDATAATRPTLGTVRERELRDACAVLGVERVRCLDYRDGTLRDVGRAALVAAVARVLDEIQPDVVITFGPDGAYGHPDHIAISEATTEAYFSTLATRHPAARLYHSHFPRSRLLLRDRLAHWLIELHERFKGGDGFAQSLTLFAEESTSLRYAGDHIEVAWFPSGLYLVEEGEPATSLYLILSGHVEVRRDRPDGSVEVLRRMGPGEFLGELGVVEGVRTASVVSLDSVTCLVFHPGKPTLFAGRGSDVHLPSFVEGLEGDGLTATTEIDVSTQITAKVRAIAAHRSQFPIQPDMLPVEMLQELMGREYFVRVHPPMPRENDLLG